MTAAIRAMLLTVILLFAVEASWAQGKGHGKGRGKGKGKGAVTVVFSPGDRVILQDWARSVPVGQLPPGLAKRGSLPPGLQKQLARNGTLPPGLEKKLSPFPAGLEGRLEPLPYGCGCERVFIDGRAMIIARASAAILDVMQLF